MKAIAVFLVVAGVGVAIGQDHGEGRALFVKTLSSAEAPSRARRAAPVSAADVLAQNILEWIQGIYRQGARKPRQQSDPPGYLPPERPRPFQPPSRNEASSHASYRRPSTSYAPSNAVRSSTVQPSSYSSQKSTYLPPNERSTYRTSSHEPRPTSTPSYANLGSSPFPPFGTSPGPTAASAAASTFSSQPGYSISAGGASTDRGYPSSSFGGTAAGTAAAGKFSTPSGFSTGYGYPTRRPGPTYVPSQQGVTVSSVSPFTGYLYPTGGTEANSNDQGIVVEYPSSSGYPSATPGAVIPPRDTGSGTSAPGAVEPTETGADTGAVPTGEGSSGSGTVSLGGTASSDDVDDDSKHPPHIHALDVACGKTMMTIDIEFNRPFDGVVYSKGFYANPECRYVEENSGRARYSFTVSLDSCGTRFINDFAGEAGQAYLENVLVLQNEPGIQEVWDTVRRVRCLWEGNINKALAVNLSVDTLSQEIATFSGDTAVAKLDIQVGRGPFAPAADGLVKIGEIMTLVVSVEGDPAFDLQVRDCVARDESSRNAIQLTDEAGCIRKPKLFGAFQKTNDTGNTGASIIAYAYFQAFKFPDVMDLIIECNVELCKTNCEPCLEPNQQIEPRRRRRSVSNGTTVGVLLADPIRVARGFRVIMADDLSKAGNQLLEQLEETAGESVARSATNVCVSHGSFYVAISFMLTTVLVATISALALYVKLHRVYGSKGTRS